jgi:predicted transcriptional regulator
MLNRTLVLNTLIRHETLTINDIAKEENLGIIPNEEHLQLLLDELTESDHVHILNGAEPRTYTITDKGIKEGTRLKAEAENSNSL